MAKAKSNARKKSENDTQSSKSYESKSLTRAEPNASSWLSAPTDLMRRVRGEMDRVFEDLGFGNLTNAWPGGENFGPALWSPQVEVFNREGQLVIRADLPGLNKDDVKVDLTDDAITIEGERKQEHEENREGYYRSERSYGRFYRSIPLPEGVNANTAQANFRNGVLEITIEAPQRVESKRRKLEIAGEPALAKAKAAGR
jgi:HSP20 family protein